MAEQPRPLGNRLEVLALLHELHQQRIPPVILERPGVADRFYQAGLGKILRAPPVAGDEQGDRPFPAASVAFYRDGFHALHRLSRTACMKVIEHPRPFAERGNLSGATEFFRKHQVRRHPADQRPQIFELPGILADTQDAEKKRSLLMNPRIPDRVRKPGRDGKIRFLQDGGCRREQLMEQLGWRAHSRGRGGLPVFQQLEITGAVPARRRQLQFDFPDLIGPRPLTRHGGRSCQGRHALHISHHAGYHPMLLAGPGTFHPLRRRRRASGFFPAADHHRHHQQAGERA